MSKDRLRGEIPIGALVEPGIYLRAYSHDRAIVGKIPPKEATKISHFLLMVSTLGETQALYEEL